MPLKTTVLDGTHTTQAPSEITKPTPELPCREQSSYDSISDTHNLIFGGFVLALALASIVISVLQLRQDRQRQARDCQEAQMHRVSLERLAAIRLSAAFESSLTSCVVEDRSTNQTITGNTQVRVQDRDSLEPQGGEMESKSSTTTSSAG
jgi:hypothetical protein